MLRNNQAKITITKKNFSKALYNHTNNPEIPLKYDHRFHQLKGLKEPIKMLWPGEWQVSYNKLLLMET